MIKLTRRVMAAGAGALAVVALGAGTTLVTGLPGGSAKADDLTSQQVLKDCDHPQEVSDTSQAYNPYGNSSVPQSVKSPTCTFKTTHDSGLVWGPGDPKWAGGKLLDVPGCEGGASMGKEASHTTGTGFEVGFAVGVGGEVWNTLEAEISTDYHWSITNEVTDTYSQTSNVPEGQVGHFEVTPALRKVTVDLEAKYPDGHGGWDTKTFNNLVMTTHDPDRADEYHPAFRPMKDEAEWNHYCAGQPYPGPTNSSSPSGSPTGSPSGSPAGPQGTKSLVNVSTGNAADVDGGRSELHSMAVNNSDGQKWNIKPGNDGRAQLEPVIKPGWALGHNTDATKIDQGVQPFALISQDAQRGDQRWRLTGAGGDAYTVTDDTGDCLTDPGKQGGTIGVFACTGGDQQRWRLGGDLPDSREKLPAPATTGNG